MVIVRFQRWGREKISNQSFNSKTLRTGENKPSANLEVAGGIKIFFYLNFRIFQSCGSEDVNKINFFPRGFPWLSNFQTFKNNHHILIASFLIRAAATHRVNNLLFNKQECIHFLIMHRIHDADHIIMKHNVQHCKHSPVKLTWLYSVKTSRRSMCFNRNSKRHV